MTVRFRPWAYSFGCEAVWRCQAPSLYSLYSFGSIPTQTTSHSKEFGCEAIGQASGSSMCSLSSIEELPSQDASFSVVESQTSSCKSAGMGGDVMDKSWAPPRGAGAVSCGLAKSRSALRGKAALAPFGHLARLRVAAVLALALIGMAQACDGVRLRDHWLGLGISSTDIELIDQLDLSKAQVEKLVMSGVSVREYSHRPWEPMGITEKQWVKQLEQGSDVGALERYYDRSKDDPEAGKPNLFLAALAPGYYQIKEDRPVGWVMAGLSAGFLALTVLKPNADGTINFVFPLCVGGTMFWSAADQWNRHRREQSTTGFSSLPQFDASSVAVSFQRSF